jgi:hypothetical protein
MKEKILLPYTENIAVGGSEMFARPNIADEGPSLIYVWRYANNNVYSIYIGYDVVGITCNTAKEAMDTLDKILIDDGYKLITHDEVDKYLVML